MAIHAGAPPNIAALMGMLGGGGGTGSGSSGDLASMLSNVMQSPHIQALTEGLTNQIQSAVVQRAHSSVAVEERDADGNTTMVEASPQRTAAGLGGIGGDQSGIARMLGAAMQSPALRQMAEDPEMQRLSQRLTGGERYAGIHVGASSSLGSQTPSLITLPARSVPGLRT